MNVNMDVLSNNSFIALVHIKKAFALVRLRYTNKKFIYEHKSG